MNGGIVVSSAVECFIFYALVQESSLQWSVVRDCEVSHSDCSQPELNICQKSLKLNQAYI